MPPLSPEKAAYMRSLSLRTQTPRPFRWTERRLRAAYLVALGDLTTEQIAGVLHICPTTLADWRAHPDFKAQAAKALDEIRAEILTESIAVKAERVRHAQQLHGRMLQVISDRATDPAATGPGAHSGLLVRSLKMLGSGQEAQVIEEYTFDANLSKEIREWQKYAAQEMGDWTERKDVTSGGERIQAFVTISPDDWDEQPPTAAAPTLPDDRED